MDALHIFDKIDYSRKDHDMVFKPKCSFWKPKKRILNSNNQHEYLDGQTFYP